MRISDWSSDVCSSDLFHRQYRMPRSQNVLRLGQNRSLGPTGPDRGRAGAVAGHQLAGPSGRLRYRHHRHQGRCRNPARRARRNQEKRKEVVMNDKLELDIPVLLPDLPDAADACLDRLVSTLSKREGVERAHVICLDGDTPAALCIHFDAAKLPLPRLREMVRAAGAEITERYGHAIWQVTGISHERRART